MKEHEKEFLIKIFTDHKTILEHDILKIEQKIEIDPSFYEDPLAIIDPYRQKMDTINKGIKIIENLF